MAGINLSKRKKKGFSFSSKKQDEAIGGFDDEVVVKSESRIGGDPERTRSLLIFILTIALVFLAPYLVDMLTKKETQRLKSKSVSIDRLIKKEDEKLRQFKSYADQARSYENQKKDIESKLRLVKSVSKNRNSIVRMIDFVVKGMPDSVWLQNIKVLPENGLKVRISGFARKLQAVSAFMEKLEGGVFFPNWTLVKGEKSSKQSANKSFPLDVKNFEINAEVVSQ